MRAGAAALPQPAARRRRVSLAPSRRSVLAGVGALLIGAGLYAAARETSAFAIRSLRVSGAPAPVVAQVRHALAPYLGKSLVGLDEGALLRRVDAIPAVVGASLDRSFPHTLGIRVVPEHPVAVLRHGSDAWLVSARGRVLERVGVGQDATFPRLWVGSAVQVGAAGAFLPPASGGVAARALAVARGFPFGIASASYANGSLAFQLRDGVALRLGDSDNLPLKLAVARRALRVLPAGSTYLDVSLPGRPVSGASAALPAVTPLSANSQVSTGG